MQSGRAKTKQWVLEPTLDTARLPEPLMGWVSSGDTNNQIRLTFESKEEAVAYAKKHDLDYIVIGDHKRRLKPKAMLTISQLNGSQHGVPGRIEIICFAAP